MNKKTTAHEQTKSAHEHHVTEAARLLGRMGRGIPKTVSEASVIARTANARLPRPNARGPRKSKTTAHEQH